MIMNKTHNHFLCFILRQISRCIKVLFVIIKLAKKKKIFFCASNRNHVLPTGFRHFISNTCFEKMKGG